MTPADKQILRELAKRKADIAHDPVNIERREAWLNLDADTSPRPMVLAEIGGIQDTRKPVSEDDLRKDLRTTLDTARNCRLETIISAPT